MYLDDSNEKTKNIKQTTLYISEGYKYLRVLRLDKAISSFEKILEKDPNNIKSLLGRAKCYMRLGRHKEALLDFQRIIELNPKCTEAVYLKGVAEYFKGNFEESYTTYWEGYKLRPAHDELRQGFELCKKAIENNLNADKRMLLTEKDTNKIASVYNEDLIVEDELDDRGDFDNTGLFSSELKQLHDLLEDKNVSMVHSLCRELFDYVRERQKFWKMHEPIKSSNKSAYMAFVRNNIFDLKKMSRLVRNFGLCKMAFKEGKSNICIKKGVETLEVLDTVSSKDFPGKIEMEAETLHCLGMAYFAEGDFSVALKYCEQQLNVVRDSNLPQSKCRALRDLGDIYHINLEFQKALDFYEESMTLIGSEDCKAIILYKISDCNVHLNNLQRAWDTANQCLKFATRSQNARLQFDAHLLLGEVAVKGKEMGTAEQYYKNALEIAVKNKDPRQKNVEVLLEFFEEIATKDSYSNERIKITEYSETIKRSDNSKS